MGAAIVWAQRAGLTVGLLSARTSGARLSARRSCHPHSCQQGVPSKLAGVRTDPCATPGSSDRMSHTWGTTCSTLPVLRRAGLSAAPADAAARCASAFDWVSAVARRSRRGSRADRARPARAGPLGRHRPSQVAVMDGYMTLLPRWSRCSPAWRSARPGSATSCWTAAGSIGGGPASLRTTCSG